MGIEASAFTRFYNLALLCFALLLQHLLISYPTPRFANQLPLMTPFCEKCWFFVVNEKVTFLGSECLMVIN